MGSGLGGRGGAGAAEACFFSRRRQNQIPPKTAMMMTTSGIAMKASFGSEWAATGLDAASVYK
jgi:hypothetical protein